MNVLGLELIMAAVIITGTGVGIQVELGVLQSTGPFNGRKLVASAIISIFAAFAIVIPILTGLSRGSIN